MLVFCDNLNFWVFSYSGFSLPDKLARAEDVEKKSKEALQEILEPFAGVTTECLQEWIDYERVVCIRSKSTENHSLSPAEEYCLVLEELTKYRGVFATDVNKDKKRLETKLKKKGKKAGVKWDSTNVDYLRTLKTAQEKLRHWRPFNRPLQRGCFC
ncbi:uncharacterized protein LOC127864949 [Dreissena polymorpha]|uniref:uncharacterized protein LOC127864949 n=1 Tax=Dreissena polymorpha TaxID=45954 RepID=UPI0022652A2B|nr:uncharacterized protein LOC127864949 [Dreissena polymorpha]